MKIETLVLGELQTNCYLVYDENSKEAVIIDPADSAEFIAEKIQNLKLKPKAIIATHGHFDHILAVGELQLLLNKSKTQNSKFLPFYIHKNELFLLKQMNQSASYWLGYLIKKPLPMEIKFLKENNKISFGNFTLEVMETPGHTPGSICLVKKLVGGARRGAPKKAQFNGHYLGLASDRIYQFFNSYSIIFSGDTLFKGTIGRYDFSYSLKEQLISSLKKISQLPKNTLIYPGHGEKTIISQEKFPFLSP